MRYHGKGVPCQFSPAMAMTNCDCLGGPHLLGAVMMAFWLTMSHLYVMNCGELWCAFLDESLPHAQLRRRSSMTDLKLLRDPCDKGSTWMQSSSRLAT